MSVEVVHCGLAFNSTGVCSFCTLNALNSVSFVVAEAVEFHSVGRYVECEAALGDTLVGLAPDVMKRNALFCSVAEECEVEGVLLGLAC